MTTKQKNYRLPEITRQQIEALQQTTGLTEVQIIILAIDRLHQQEQEKDTIKRP